jgi:hypothetical protein
MIFRINRAGGCKQREACDGLHGQGT